jgi:SAM-dependent methyltransferase
MTTIHPSAAQGFAAAAQTYVRGRPGYPAELLPWLTGELELQAGRTCVDLGAGTGKFTALLVQTGAEVIAVEPVAEMRRQLVADLPGVRALEGTAEAMPLPDASAHAVLCAQAFHWFANERTVEEIHRVLKPGGRLGLVWNVRDESVGWVAALTKIMAPYETGTPRYRTGLWRQAFAGQPFTALEETCFPHQHLGNPREVIIDRTLSVSFIAAQSEDVRERIAGQLRDLIDGHPDLRGRERIAFPYRTHAFQCKKLTDR